MFAIDLMHHPRPLIESPIVLVVSAPQDDTRMMTQFPDRLSNFLVAHLSKPFEMIRVFSRGKHKVLPYHYSQFITQGVELLVFVYPATPDSQHVHVRIACHVKQLAIVLRLYPAENTVGRYPVRALRKDTSVIDGEDE